jgi:methylmalonyl-CoA mutase N-terminal domain/subunit
VIVGVNRFADGAEAPVAPAPDYSALERTQASRLAELRTHRDGAAVASALGALRDAAGARDGSAADRAPLMPLIVSAVRARATVGEISDVLREAWGVYRPTA